MTRWSFPFALPYYLGNELQVEGSSDLQLLAHGMHDGFDPLQGFSSDILWWGYQRGIS